MTSSTPATLESDSTSASGTRTSTTASRPSRWTATTTDALPVPGVRAVANGRLEGKRAIVSGAGMGMGRAAALRFAAEGARVGLLDVDETAARAVAEEIEAAGGGA